MFRRVTFGIIVLVLSLINDTTSQSLNDDDTAPQVSLPAVIITGGVSGKFDEKSETVASGQSVLGPSECVIPEMPHGGLEGHNLVLTPNGDNLLSCGGWARGGYGDDYEKKCYMFNTETQTWEFHSDLHDKRWKATAINMPNGLYIFGGHKDSRKLSEFLPKENNTKEWQKTYVFIPDGFSDGCGVKISDEELLLIGGLGKGHTTGYSDRVLNYNIKTKAFTNWPRLNFRRRSHSCTLLNDKVIVAGGAEHLGGKKVTTEIIPLATKTPIKGGLLNKVRHNFGMMTLGSPINKVVAFGGKSAERYWDTVGGLEIWDDVTQTWTLTSEPDAIPGLTFRNDSGKKYGFGYLVMTSCPSCGITMKPCQMIIMLLSIVMATRLFERK